MKPLLQAIYTKVTELTGGNHNSFYNAISGRFYFVQAPQETAFPYSVYHLLTDTYDFTFTEEFEEIIIQFDMYDQDPSSSDILDATEYLKTLFDWCRPTVTGYSVSHGMERIFSTIDWFDEDGVWQSVVQYRISLKKN
jgi:hypothetical protein